MHRRALFTCGFAFLAFLFTSSAVQAQMAGELCPNELGVTKFNNDKTGIIACLRATATDATLVWKSMGGPKNVQCYSFMGRPGGVLRALSTLPSWMNVTSVVAMQTYNAPATFTAHFPHANLSPGTDAGAYPLTGIRCLGGYFKASCSVAQNAGATDWDLIQSDNGCFVDDEETALLDAFYITCCE